MASDDQQAWRDWQRVEACIAFGAGRWWITVFAMMLAWIWLIKKSDWLLLVALTVILGVHSWRVKRVNAKRMKGEVDERGIEE